MTGQWSVDYAWYGLLLGSSIFSMRTLYFFLVVVYLWRITYGSILMRRRAIVTSIKARRAPLNVSLSSHRFAYLSPYTWEHLYSRGRSFVINTSLAIPSEHFSNPCKHTLSVFAFHGNLDSSSVPKDKARKVGFVSISQLRYMISATCLSTPMLVSILHAIDWFMMTCKTVASISMSGFLGFAELYGRTSGIAVLLIIKAVVPQK